MLDILMFGIGGIVGAGIYAIVGEAAGISGHLLWASFLVAAVVALLTATTYAEFVSRFPDAGGSFEYVKQGFGRTTALWFSIMMLFTGVVAAAAIAISFGQYLGRLLEVPLWVTTAGVIILMGLINAVGVQQASWFNTLATVVTLAGLAAVVFFAVPEWGSVPLLSSEGVGWTGIASGGALIFFSFIGYEDLVKMAEETRDPRKTMPRGILISGVVVLLIYLLIAVSAVSVIPPDDLARESGPLAAVLRRSAGAGWATAIVVVALFATSKTILSNILGTSRLLYDVARDGGMPWLQRLTQVNESTGTPLLATLLITLLALGFGLIGNLKVVASISNIFIMLVFLAVNAALLNYRRLHADEQDPPFRVPLSVGRYPLPTILAFAGVLILLGFNVANIVG
ncbi:APC family permease [Neolewinella litorea]|uniref:Amino acid permease n=1 Tax=Neolewinella litorea TaxID=2562452 RepID=A0A4S4NNJ9_9BACT|nr:APC family permease [Neolewinella litorea]THH41576.1 amino acid permease [Neolewinella litorea]